MRVYRLVKARYAAHALDGSGAKTYGGRWNGPGTAVIYASQSVALAALELLVHLGRGEVLNSYRLFALTIPDGAVLTLDDAALPADWRADPPPKSTAGIGDRWVASGRSVALLVPSTVITGERNCLLNPTRPEFTAIAADATDEPFGFDPRLTAAPWPPEL
jgi:RES domain-containing protein